MSHLLPFENPRAALPLSILGLFNKALHIRSKKQEAALIFRGIAGVGVHGTLLSVTRVFNAGKPDVEIILPPQPGLGGKNRKFLLSYVEDIRVYEDSKPILPAKKENYF